jgi:hypothetical protein
MLLVLCVVSSIMYGAGYEMPYFSYYLSLKTILSPMAVLKDVVVPESSIDKYTALGVIDCCSGVVIEPQIRRYANRFWGENKLGNYTLCWFRVPVRDVSYIRGLTYKGNPIDCWGSSSIAKTNGCGYFMRNAVNNFFCGRIHVVWGRPTLFDPTSSAFGPTERHFEQPERIEIERRSDTPFAL